MAIAGNTGNLILGAGLFLFGGAMTGYWYFNRLKTSLDVLDDEAPWNTKMIGWYRFYICLLYMNMSLTGLGIITGTLTRGSRNIIKYAVLVLVSLVFVAANWLFAYSVADSALFHEEFSAKTYGYMTALMIGGILLTVTAASTVFMQGPPAMQVAEQVIDTVSDTSPLLGSDSV